MSNIAFLANYTNSARLFTLDELTPIWQFTDGYLSSSVAFGENLYLRTMSNRLLLNVVRNGVPQATSFLSTINRVQDLIPTKLSSDSVIICTDRLISVVTVLDCNTDREIILQLENYDIFPNSCSVSLTPNSVASVDRFSRSLSVSSRHYCASTLDIPINENILSSNILDELRTNQLDIPLPNISEWSLSNPLSQIELPAALKSITTPYLIPDSLLTISFELTPRLSVVDLSCVKTISEYTLDQNKISAVDSSPFTPFLLTCGTNTGTVSFFDTRTKKCVTETSVLDHSIEALTFHHDAQTIGIGSSEGELNIVDLRTFRSLLRVERSPEDSAISNIQFLNQSFCSVSRFDERENTLTYDKSTSIESCPSLNNSRNNSLIQVEEQPQIAEKIAASPTEINKYLKSKCEEYTSPIIENNIFDKNNVVKYSPKCDTESNISQVLNTKHSEIDSSPISRSKHSLFSKDQPEVSDLNIKCSPKAGSSSIQSIEESTMYTKDSGYLDSYKTQVYEDQLHSKVSNTLRDTELLDDSIYTTPLSTPELPYEFVSKVEDSERLDKDILASPVSCLNPSHGHALKPVKTEILSHPVVSDPLTSNCYDNFYCSETKTWKFKERNSLDICYNSETSVETLASTPVELQSESKDILTLPIIEKGLAEKSSTNSSARDIVTSPDQRQASSNESTSVAVYFDPETENINSITDDKQGSPDEISTKKGDLELVERDIIYSDSEGTSSYRYSVKSGNTASGSDIRSSWQLTGRKLVNEWHVESEDSDGHDIIFSSLISEQNKSSICTKQSVESGVERTNLQMSDNNFSTTNTLQSKEKELNNENPLASPLLKKNCSSEKVRDSVSIKNKKFLSLSSEEVGSTNSNQGSNDSRSNSSQSVKNSIICVSSELSSDTSPSSNEMRSLSYQRTHLKTSAKSEVSSSHSRNSQVRSSPQVSSSNRVYIESSDMDRDYTTLDPFSNQSYSHTNLFAQPRVYELEGSNLLNTLQQPPKKLEPLMSDKMSETSSKSAQHYGSFQFDTHAICNSEGSHPELKGTEASKERNSLINDASSNSDILKETNGYTPTSDISDHREIIDSDKTLESSMTEQDSKLENENEIISINRLHNTTAKDDSSTNNNCHNVDSLDTLVSTDDEIYLRADSVDIDPSSLNIVSLEVSRHSSVTHVVSQSNTSPTTIFLRKYSTDLDTQKQVDNIDTFSDQLSVFSDSSNAQYQRPLQCNQSNISVLELSMDAVRPTQNIDLVSSQSVQTNRVEYGFLEKLNMKNQANGHLQLIKNNRQTSKDLSGRCEERSLSRGYRTCEVSLPAKPIPTTNSLQSKLSFKKSNIVGYGLSSDEEPYTESNNSINGQESLLNPISSDYCLVSFLNNYTSEGLNNENNVYESCATLNSYDCPKSVTKYLNHGSSEYTTVSNNIYNTEASIFGKDTQLYFENITQNNLQDSAEYFSSASICSNLDEEYYLSPNCSIGETSGSDCEEQKINKYSPISRDAITNQETIKISDSTRTITDSFNVSQAELLNLSYTTTSMNTESPSTNKEKHISDLSTSLNRKNRSLFKGRSEQNDEKSQSLEYILLPKVPNSKITNSNQERINSLDRNANKDNTWNMDISENSSTGFFTKIPIEKMKHEKSKDFSVQEEDDSFVVLESDKSYITDNTESKERDSRDIIRYNWVTPDTSANALNKDCKINLNSSVDKVEKTNEANTNHKYNLPYQNFNKDGVLYLPYRSTTAEDLRLYSCDSNVVTEHHMHQKIDRESLNLLEIKNPRSSTLYTTPLRTDNEDEINHKAKDISTFNSENIKYPVDITKLPLKALNILDNPSTKNTNVFNNLQFVKNNPENTFYYTSLYKSLKPEFQHTKINNRDISQARELQNKNFRRVSIYKESINQIPPFAKLKPDGSKAERPISIQISKPLLRIHKESKETSNSLSRGSDTHMANRGNSCGYTSRLSVCSNIGMHPSKYSQSPCLSQRKPEYSFYQGVSLSRINISPKSLRVSSGERRTHYIPLKQQTESMNNILHSGSPYITGRKTKYVILPTIEDHHYKQSISPISYRYNVSFSPNKNYHQYIKSAYQNSRSNRDPISYSHRSKISVPPVAERFVTNLKPMGIYNNSKHNGFKRYSTNELSGIQNNCFTVPNRTENIRNISRSPTSACFRYNSPASIYSNNTKSSRNLSHSPLARSHYYTKQYSDSDRFSSNQNCGSKCQVEHVYTLPHASIHTYQEGNNERQKYYISNATPKSLEVKKMFFETKPNILKLNRYNSLEQNKASKLDSEIVYRNDSDSKKLNVDPEIVYRNNSHTNQCNIDSEIVYRNDSDSKKLNVDAEMNLSEVYSVSADINNTSDITNYIYENNLCPNSTRSHDLSHCNNYIKEYHSTFDIPSSYGTCTRQYNDADNDFYTRQDPYARNITSQRPSSSQYIWNNSYFPNNYLNTLIPKKSEVTRSISLSNDHIFRFLPNSIKSTVNHYSNKESY